jgi:hypothetical protein
MAAFVPPQFNPKARIPDPLFPGLMTTLEQTIDEQMMRMVNGREYGYKWASYAYVDESKDDDGLDEFIGATSSEEY